MREKNVNLHVAESNLVADPAREEDLCIRLALQVERFLLGVDHSIELIVNWPDIREEYQRLNLMLNTWEGLIGFLVKLRRCFVLALELPDYKIAAAEGIKQFDELVPNLKNIRNLFEHFDDYILGNGNNKSVDPKQAISYGMSPSNLFYGDMQISILKIQEATDVVRRTFLTGYILSVIENNRLTFTTFVQRKKYEAQK